ncbi:Eukaryotic translation initiation factor 3 subunit K [Zancudomyces culisetae]|uniref:Eukaryotic translation initiation factor 3 subunit K n=1 Tax=Zancudomyces culisetae TaxID=1213189 RepID=A0A1R1PSB4_ZANCU|nr:Eukaryotic translation initiation factor 3 subunit K [Zancudomyces culisetae]|eukprot:OMH83875.1 Eukaryotic translation initiation factor 3 subunit K [Zancudomyces culisetae]
MSFTVRPPIRTDKIQEIITTVERYNPQNIPVLEAYLKEQCNSFSEHSNDPAANLALLKLYQFNPELLNIDAIGSILIKALTNLPGNDFILCLYLLSEQIISDESIVKILELKDLLETARFDAFWDILSNDSITKEITGAVKGFDDSIRSMIAKNISVTHQSATSEFLQLALNLDESDLSDFAKQQGWTINEETGIVTLPLIKDNEAKAVVISEQIPFVQLTKILASSSEL